jgi:hypothetical protein
MEPWEFEKEFWADYFFQKIARGDEIVIEDFEDPDVTEESLLAQLEDLEQIEKIIDSAGSDDWEEVAPRDILRALNMEGNKDGR